LWNIAIRHAGDDALMMMMTEPMHVNLVEALRMCERASGGLLPGFQELL
jgi:hypothetical protein